MESGGLHREVKRHILTFTCKQISFCLFYFYFPDNFWCNPNVKVCPQRYTDDPFLLVPLHG